MDEAGRRHGCHTLHYLALTDMKGYIVLLVVLVLAGCGNREGSAPARRDHGPGPEKATAQTQPCSASQVDKAYAKGVVTLKTGRKVAGQILLQCPGYLTVCFKVESSKPEDSELVPNEEVQSVTLEEALSELDPRWLQLAKEMTIIAPGGKNRH